VTTPVIGYEQKDLWTSGAVAGQRYQWFLALDAQEEDKNRLATESPSAD